MRVPTPVRQRLVAGIIGLIVIFGFLQQSHELVRFSKWTSSRPQQQTAATSNHTRLRLLAAPTNNRSSSSSSSSYDTITSHTTTDTTDLQQCRLDLELWLGPKIDEWLEADLPLLDWVWIRQDDDDDTSSTFYQIMLHIVHLNKKRRKEFHLATWYCQDERGNQTQTQLASTSMISNKRGDKIYIRCNTTESFAPTLIYPDIDIASSGSGSTPASLRTSSTARPTSNSTSTATNPRSMVMVYYELGPILECDQLEQANPQPPKPIQLAACLKFRGDSDRHLIPQWIEYHRLLGMQHFWIFANEPPPKYHHPNGTRWIMANYDDTALDITYIPYPYTWRGPTNHGNHSKFRPYRDGNNFWQSTALNQCLHMAKRYGVEWFTTTDVDEYIWVSPEDRDDDYSNSTTPPSTFPLRRFLDNLSLQPKMKTVGALIMNSIPFGRNASVPLEVLEPNTQPQPPLVMDYTFRHQKDTPWEIKHHRWKCIYHAPVAQVISVHNLDQGGEKRYMDASTQVRVNHYKSPQTVGVYQAAPNQLIEDSSLPDRYRELVVEALVLH